MERGDAGSHAVMTLDFTLDEMEALGVKTKAGSSSDSGSGLPLYSVVKRRGGRREKVG